MKGNHNSRNNKNFGGHRHTEESKERIRQKMVGRKLSEETISRMSQARKAYWNRKRAV